MRGVQSGVWRYELARWFRDREGEPWTAREFATRYDRDVDDGRSSLRMLVRLGVLVVIRREPRGRGMPRNYFAPVLGETVCGVLAVDAR